MCTPFNSDVIKSLSQKYAAKKIMGCPLLHEYSAAGGVGVFM